MIRQKIHRHFLPHYFVELGSAAPLGHDSVHHRAHAISVAALFFYLQLLLAVTVVLHVASVRVPQVLGKAIFGSGEIVQLTNAQRSKLGLAPLTFNRQLSAAAAAKAEDMLANDYWAHNSPAGKTPWNFITTAGYNYIFAGENLARDFSDASGVVGAWMQSPSHRANLLDGNFRDIGVAVVRGELNGREGTLVVQMFGASTSPTLAFEGNTGEAATFGAADTGGVTVAASRKFAIAKGITLVMVAFIFALFAAETLVTLRRAHVHVRSGVFAHLTLLAFVLLAVWYSVEGAIL